MRRIFATQVAPKLATVTPTTRRSAQADGRVRHRVATTARAGQPCSADLSHDELIAGRPVIRQLLVTCAG